MYQYLIEEIRKRNALVAQIMEEKTTDLQVLQTALSLVSEETLPPDELEKLPRSEDKDDVLCGVAGRLEMLYNEAETVEAPIFSISGLTCPMSQKEFKMLKAIILTGVSPNTDVSLQLQPLLKACMMNVVGKVPLLKGIGKNGEYFHDKVLLQARKLLKIDGALGFSEDELHNIDQLAQFNIIG